MWENIENISRRIQNPEQDHRKKFFLVMECSFASRLSFELYHVESAFNAWSINHKEDDLIKINSHLME